MVRLLFLNMTLILTLALPFLSCKSQKTMFDPNDSKEEFISFGNGGGFTGAVTEYYLTKKGGIYIKEGETIREFGKISTAKSKQLLSNFYSLELDKTELNAPGNRYFFIRSNQNNEKKQLMWGKGNLENVNIETYYNVLMQIIKKYSLEHSNNN